MQMQELTNQKVKISSHTITVKDDNNKTRGMIRNVRPFKECQTNVQMNIWKTARQYNIELDKLFYVDGQWWYIYNTKWDEDYHRYFENKNAQMDKKYKERCAAYETINTETNINIIKCYIL